MSSESETQARELNAADLEHAVGGGETAERVSLSDLSIVKTLDRSSAAGGGGGAGKVQMQDFHFVAK